METQPCYTAQEIFKAQMLLNTKGTPMKSHAHVHRTVTQKATGVTKTPRGLIKVLTKQQIDEHNAEMLEMQNHTYIPDSFISTT